MQDGSLAGRTASGRGGHGGDPSRCCAPEDTLKVGHNLKYDITVLKQQWGIELGGELADTLIAAYLTESGGQVLKARRSVSGPRRADDDLCRGHGSDKRDDCFAYVDIEKAGIYSCEDVYGAFMLWQEFAPLLEAKGVMDLFRRVEMPIVTILAEMEIAGIRVDTAVLASSIRRNSPKSSGMLEEQIYALAGHAFNINSPQQLGQVLFEEQGLPMGRKNQDRLFNRCRGLGKTGEKK